MRRRLISNHRLTAIPTARPQNLQLLKVTFRPRPTGCPMFPTYALLHNITISGPRTWITMWFNLLPHLSSTMPLIKMQVTLTCRADQIPKCTTDQTLLREDQWLVQEQHIEHN